jgi:hypothetical protein
MIEPIILEKGNFKPRDLSIKISRSNRKTDHNLEVQLDDLWAKKQKKAKENNQLLYNGLLYRLNSIKLRGGKLFIDFGVIDFKTRECLIEAKGYYGAAEGYWRKGCHTLATVKTSDDKYLMVELSGKSMNKNKVDFLGGIMETKPSIKSGGDIFKSLYRELGEEAFIKKGDIASSILHMIYVTHSTDVGFYFEILLKVTSDELGHRFNKGKKEIDIKSLKVMSHLDFIKELESHNYDKQFLATQVNI